MTNSKSKKKPVTTRILAFDTSLSRPGAAVIAVTDGIATIEALSHTKTNPDDPYAVRGAQIEHWAHLFAREHRKKGYDHIGREGYSGNFGHHSMFSAWAGVDRGLHYLGLATTEKPIAQQSVKKHVVGKGKAEKEEVANAVRAITGYEGIFAVDDESDAAACGLAIAMVLGLIPSNAPKPKGKGASK